MSSVVRPNLIGDRTQTTTILSGGSATATNSTAAHELAGRTVRLRHSRSTAGDTKKVERAVYAYIQAVRALGKQRISTDEIARALGLSRSVVESVVLVLRSKGVRPL